MTMSWVCDSNLVSTILHPYQTAGPSLLAALQLFLTSQCLMTPKVFEETSEDRLKEIAAKTFDFIIVGGGTAGAVVASRLSEVQDWKVLLLEAGGTPTLGTEIPQLFINNYGTEQDWKYRTEPQTRACLNYKEQRCYWPRGKVLGGSSSINGMYYIRGNKADYDGWRTIDDEWSYENVLAYFKKSENYDSDDDIEDDDKFHGKNGLLNVEYEKTMHELEEVIINANKEMGVNVNKDFNGVNQMGVGVAATATKMNQRQSTVNSFLKPIIDRRNLEIVTDIEVDKIVFDGLKAKGVECAAKNGKKYTIYANKEIILSAGTINSAKILLNSGIGPNDDSFVNLPVGENLQDHIYAPIMFKMKSTDNVNAVSNIFKAYFEYVTEKKGPLGDLRPQRVISFINSTDPNALLPDIQNHFIVVYPNQSNIVDIFHQHRLSDEFHKSFNEINKNHLIVIVYVTLLQPKSKGSIELDENGEVIIKANYLHHEEDLQTLVKGMKEAIKLADTDVFKKSNLDLFWINIEACKGINKDDDVFFKCIAENLTGTLYHAVGTNAMGGNDTKAVVNKELMVKNVINLRVIDASVIPNIIRGNTMAAVVMVAEKGADFVKKRFDVK